MSHFNSATYAAVGIVAGVSGLATGAYGVWLALQDSEADKARRVGEELGKKRAEDELEPAIKAAEKERVAGHMFGYEKKIADLKEHFSKLF